MALLLSIETSTSACSVALHENGNIVGEMNLYLDKSHSSYLTLMVEKVIEYSGYKLQDIHAFAFSKGPGSYTGLRIGVSTAKGLCFALEKPLISVNTLQAMALQLDFVADKNSLLCPMIDARRMEVYTALFNSKNEFVKETCALVIDENSFKEELEKQKLFFFGNGAAKCKPTFENTNAVFIENIHPKANEIGKIAYQKYLKNEFEDVAYFEPYYLKEFVGK